MQKDSRGVRSVSAPRTAGKLAAYVTVLGAVLATAACSAESPLAPTAEAGTVEAGARPMPSGGSGGVSPSGDVAEGGADRGAGAGPVGEAGGARGSGAASEASTDMSNDAVTAEPARDASALRDGAAADAPFDAIARPDGEAGNGNTVDLYLIGGQSNATGQGYTKNIPPTFIVSPSVELYHSPAIISGAAANTWIPLRHASEGPDAAGTRFGPELGFGNGMQSAFPDRHIAIIKHAKSATNLVQQWAPGASPSDTAHFGPEFATFVATVDGGLRALRAQGETPVVRGMLWQQGEADADLAGAASLDYGRNLTALIARVREQWSSPAMLFVYGHVYPRSNFGLGRDQVRQAETNVDQDSGHPLALRGAHVVLTDDLELRAEDPGTPYPNDLIHFGSAGQLELGARLAKKMTEKLQ